MWVSQLAELRTELPRANRPGEFCCPPVSGHWLGGCAKGSYRPEAERRADQVRSPIIDQGQKRGTAQNFCPNRHPTPEHQITMAQPRSLDQRSRCRLRYSLGGKPVQVLNARVKLVALSKPSAEAMSPIERLVRNKSSMARSFLSSRTMAVSVVPFARSLRCNDCGLVPTLAATVARPSSD